MSLTIAVYAAGFWAWWQGSNLDLRLWRNEWRLLDPDVDCLMSDCNEACSAGDDLARMGARLAEETAASLRGMFGTPQHPSKRCRLARLSFVGHSLGAVVIRAALMRMCPSLRNVPTRPCCHCSSMQDNMGQHP